MPPKIKFNKESVMESALMVVRKKGMEALSARAISERLGCSARPIYSLYDDMENLKTDLFMLINFSANILQTFLRKKTTQIVAL